MMMLKKKELEPLVAYNRDRIEHVGKYLLKDYLVVIG